MMGRRMGDGFFLFCADAIAVFPILADAVDVKRGDQLCETCPHTWHGYGYVAGRSVATRRSGA